MQRAYISKLMELAERDSRVMHLLADSGTGYDEMLHRNFPDQMVNFGISEQNMVGAAAGLAAAGRIPFAYTAAAFLAYRSFEFIRDDVCFNNLNVKIVGMGSGLAWSTLGPSHHTTEDVAVLRALPNLTILSPATPNQVAACTQLAYDIQGPVYMRIGMNNEKEFFEPGTPAVPGGYDQMYEGRDLVVFSTGSILEESEAAVRMLREQGIDAGLVNVYGVKPFPVEAVLRAAESARKLVTVEEHSVYGGLGGIVSEILTDRGCGVKLQRIGLEGVFARGYGTQKAVRRENGLDAAALCGRIAGEL